MSIITSVNDLPKNDNKKGKLYQGFFKTFIEDHLLTVKFYKTWNSRYEKDSENSVSFIYTDKTGEDLKKEVLKILKGVFQPSNISLFDKKFQEAISGNGQEYMKIATLHSSSLVALLCFYNVCKDNTLTISFNNENYVFDRSYFEVKNGSNQSNIDITLTGKKEKTEETVILFLESKFFEYMEPAKDKDISPYFNDIYYEIKDSIEELSIRKDDTDVTIREEDKKWVITAKKGSQYYCQGIKQMVSHYVGITNGFFDKNKGMLEEKRVENGDFRGPFDHIFLSELIFEFGDNVDSKNKQQQKQFDRYCKIYKQLAERLNTINKEKGFMLLENALTYQDIFSNQNKEFLDKNVKIFYHL